MSTGQVAYETYCDSRNWKAYNEEPLKDWSELHPDMRHAWQLAAGAAVSHYLDSY